MFSSSRLIIIFKKIWRLFDPFELINATLINTLNVINILRNYKKKNCPILNILAENK